MRDYLLMNSRERERKAMLVAVAQGYINLTETSKRLCLSYRQCKRLWKRYCAEGDKGLIHGSRGKPSNRSSSSRLKQEVLRYYESQLMGFGPTLASEKLALAGYTVDHETLRRWLGEASLWKSHQRKSPYRKQRERRHCFGELVQLDGSFHDWFEDGNKHCLMNMVDDATSATQALLFDEETTEAALRILWHWIDLYGVPQALYTDKRIVYVTSREPTIEEQLAGKKPLTAFGLACQKLGIEIITAHSPQAKGRVERSNGVYQDRLVKELRFQQIRTREDANTLLKKEFCQQLNEKFACEPAKTKNGHRKLKRNEKLYHILCWEEERRLNNDWTVRYKNQFYQIDKSHHRVIKPKTKLTIRMHLNKEISIFYKDKALKFQAIDNRPAKPKKPLLSEQNISEVKRKASANSPWRQFKPGWLKGNPPSDHAQNINRQGVSNNIDP